MCRCVLIIVFLVELTFAAVVHEDVRYPATLRYVRGKIVQPSFRRRDVQIEVFDNGQLGMDHTLSLHNRRSRQTKVASVHPDEGGKFQFKGLSKGLYEVEFSFGNGGWNVLSVLVDVDPLAGKKEEFCVELSLEGSGEPSKMNKC